MDDVTKSAYAEWLEEVIKGIMENKPVLGKANCAISIMWKVIEEGGEADA